MLASIIERSTGAITFTVDDVKPAQDRLPLESATAQFARRCGAPLMTFSHDESSQLVQADGNHPLVSAVHLAFSQHRPLLLTPDDIWMVIAQGFAQHLNNYAEALRDRFVRHQGKITLEVTSWQLSTPQDWADAVDGWIAAIRGHVGAGLERLLLCDFTTSTPTIRTASQVAMMDAFQQYFDYRLVCICGIPRITLLGTPDDWRRLRERVGLLAEYALEWWTSRLIPICDALVETAEGRPPLEFWRSIYKPEEVYGGEVVTGWLADLFPYINEDITNAPSLRNPILATPRDELTVDHGILPDHFPNGLSQAPFVLSFQQNEYRLALVAGFIGVSQHPATGQLHPEIGWAVCPQDQLPSFLDKITREHEISASGDLPSSPADLPGELIQMLDRFDGATLFAGSAHTWHIRQVEAYQSYEITDINEYAAHFIDLQDGRCVAYAFVRRPQGDQTTKFDRTSALWSMLGQPIAFPDSVDTHREYQAWIVVGRPITSVNPDWQWEETVLRLEETIVVAKSLTQLFERIFQAEGRYYFDEPGFVPDTTLEPLSL